MDNASHTYSVILMGRFPGKDRAVAQALSRCFSRDDTWGLQVVGATPITILTDLSAAEAQGIYQELVKVEENAGCRFKVHPGLDESYPSVSWPSRPRVFGRSIDTYSAGSTNPQLPTVMESRGAQSAGAFATIICPCCKEPIQVSLAAQPAPETARIPAPAAAATTAPGRPKIPIPVPKPATTQPGKSMAAQVSAPPSPSSQIESIDVEELEELTPLPQAPPPLRANSSIQSKSSGTRSPSPLPEVPVMATETPTPKPIASLVRPMDPRLSGPMALEDFEKGLMTGPSSDTPEDNTDNKSPIRHTFQSSRKDRKRLPTPQPPDDLKEDTEGDQLCSIFIGRNPNPKVHELVAEIQGITVKEAQRLCQKSVVPIVKDIPLREADHLKERFREIKVNPRVTLKH